MAQIGQLNGKQRQFLKCYVGRDPELHGNATRCYKAVYGLTDTRSASVCGSQMTKHPVISKLIAEALERQNQKIVIDAGFVLAESKRLYDRAMGDAPISDRVTIETDPETGQERVKAVLRHEYDPATARQALQMIGQHKSVQAFTQTVEHSHTHRLEQRLAARSKQIEASAGNLGLDPSIVGVMPASQEAIAAQAAVVADPPKAKIRKKRVSSGGGQSETSADE